MTGRRAPVGSAVNEYLSQIWVITTLFHTVYRSPVVYRYGLELSALTRFKALFQLNCRTNDYYLETFSIFKNEPHVLDTFFE